MKKVLFTALLFLSVNVLAVPTLTMEIIDLGGVAPTETFTDAGTPGSLAVTTGNSAILAAYWGTASLQVAATNNIDPSQPFGELINASINLDAINPLGTNVGIVITADGFTNLPTGDATAFTIINAATVDATAFDAAVFVDAIEIIDVEGINTTDTYAASKSITIGTTYSITHVFDLTSLAVGGDLGFDISTAVGAVPMPVPLALMGLGLIGMIGIRKLV